MTLSTDPEPNLPIPHISLSLTSRSIEYLPGPNITVMIVVLILIKLIKKLQLGFHQDVFLCFCDQETAARFPIWSSTLHQFSPVNIQFSGTYPLNNYYLLYFSINACSIQ